MAEHVLVTGGAGYLGSILVPRLLSEGRRVTVLDSFKFDQSSLLDVCANPDLSIVRGDCRDKATLEPLLKDVDFIIPLAALVGGPICNGDKLAATSTNLEAVQTVLKLRSKDQGVIFPCTNSGYGIGQKDQFCTEETPMLPISLYGETKVDAEKAVLDAGNSLSFRLATVFGASPRMRMDLLVNDFVWRAIKDTAVVLYEAHFKRNFIHVRDVAKAFLHSMDNFETMKGGPYNVGLSDANLSKLELCQRIKKHLPKFTFLEAGVGEDPDKRDYVVSNEKIEKTGWSPDHSLDDGIQELIKTYRIIRPNVYGNV